jgi:Fic family protein
MSTSAKIGYSGQMTERERFERILETVERDVDRVSTSPPALVATRRLFDEEIARSTSLAGSRLGFEAVRALLARDEVAAGHTLGEHVIVADYAEAARFVRAAQPMRRRAFFAIDELATLHTLVVARSLGARPGRWRESTARPFPSGTVPPPAWLVPRDVAGLIDRFALGPREGVHRLVWAADAHARFLRIHPFDSGNGRVARLMLNLLLRRAGFPPFVVRPRDESRYLAALRRADSRDPWPLAYVIARSLLETLGLLLEADPTDALAPLATFATGAERAALYKAAQRGRLRSVPRGRTLLTTRAWIEEYRTAQ